MKLYDAVTKHVLVGRVVLADGAWKRFKGLMLESPKKFDYALVMDMGFESAWRSSIHMLFMRFPIQAVFLDRQKIVVDQIVLHPWTFNYTPKKPARYVVEIPQGIEPIVLGSALDWK